VRNLWLITAAMIALGLALVLGGLATGLGPFLLVGGVLLIWSALVKAIVLRIWHATLGSPPLAGFQRPDTRARSSLGQPS
jgi:hypothetical protein